MNVRIRLMQGKKVVNEMTGQVIKDGDLNRLTEAFWKKCSPPWGCSEFIVEKV